MSDLSVRFYHHVAVAPLNDMATECICAEAALYTCSCVCMTLFVRFASGVLSSVQLLAM